jgi:Ca2+-binding EF-hand superfamily protein
MIVSQWFSVFDARSIFEKYDDDGSGALGSDELQHVLADLGMQVTPELLETALSALDAGRCVILRFNIFAYN